MNAQGTPAMLVDITSGSCYITATPSGQVSQLLRANMTATYTSYAISANASGSTKYDWIYLSVNATNANNPASDASDVTSLVTSRSSSNTADNGSPPTYGQLLAIVTVANGASSITNSNITDKRTQATVTPGANYNFLQDYVESGCVWTADSAGATLNASMTSGFVWLSGVRLSVASVSARAFTASKDTYVDFSNNGDGTAALTYTTATNNAASPALTAGSLRNAIVVTGASSIAASTSINQGQETRVLPIASSIPYTVTDSLGNRICPRDPERRLLGYRQLVSSFTTTSSTLTDVTGINMSINVPANRKILVTVGADYWTASSTSGIGIAMSINDVTAGVEIGGLDMTVPGTSWALNPYFQATYTVPAGGVRNLKLQASTAANTLTISATSTRPAFMRVELI